MMMHGTPHLWNLLDAVQASHALVVAASHLLEDSLKTVTMGSVVSFLFTVLL